MYLDTLARELLGLHCCMLLLPCPVWQTPGWCVRPLSPAPPRSIAARLCFLCCTVLAGAPPGLFVLVHQGLPQTERQTDGSTSGLRNRMRAGVPNKAKTGRMVVLNHTHGLSMRFCSTDRQRSATQGLPQRDHRRPANTDQTTICIEPHCCMFTACCWEALLRP